MIGLGSNLPIPERNIIKTINYIKVINQIKILKYSSFYLSEPAGYRDQPIFVNCSVLIETNLNPKILLKKLKNIEKIMGRVKTFKNGPRIIDIDILLCDELKINYKKLKIPHKKFLKRPFEFLPSLEIAPSFIHPIEKKSLRDLSLILNFEKKAYRSIMPAI